MIPVNKRKVGVCILLSFLTLGIYKIYWAFLLIENTRAVKEDKSSCTGEFLCLLFVPFYSLFWWFTRGKLVKYEFAGHGYKTVGNKIAYLILSIFGLDIISMAVMQNDFNSLPSEYVRSIKRDVGFSRKIMLKKEISNEPIYYVGSGFKIISKRNRFLRIYSIVLTVILLFAIVGGALYLIFRPLTPAEVVEKNVSAVVAIETYTYKDDGNVVIGTGSGFIVDKSGYIVTNEHVVSGKDSISVRVKGKKDYNARIVATDANADVAVLKIFSDETGYSFPTVTLGRAEDLTVGEQVVAIGTPQEIAYAWTSTVGYVSSSIRYFSEYGALKRYIQFDAAVNGGNSGGPLFDSKGRVVGIVEKKVLNNEGLGLAIPIETVKNFIDSSIKEDRSKPQLGVVGVSVEKDVEYFRQGDKIYGIGEVETEDGEVLKYIVKDFEIIEFTDEIASYGTVFVAEATGFKVWSTVEGSGAYGVIRENDIITGFDGIELLYDEEKSPYDIIIEILETKKAGDIVELQIVRNGELVTESIKLTPRK